MSQPQQPTRAGTLRQEVTAIAATELNISTHPQQVVDVFRKSALLLDYDIQVNQRRQRTKPQDCKPGCSACCYSMVLARMTDIVGALEYVLANFTPEQTEALKKRIFDYERKVAPFFGENHRQVRAQCPFLENDLCSIYEARPMRCRGINSLDVTVCEQIKNDPNFPGERPATPGQVELLVAAQEGLSDVMAGHGAYRGAFDFGRAIGIVLDNPKALESMFTGGDDFTPAALRNALSREPRFLNAAPYYPTYKPGDEPVGQIVPADLAPAFEKYTDGDFFGAMAMLTGRHPVNLMGRVSAPLLYRSEEELLRAREHLVKAVQDLDDASFDPREAFDALVSMNTFGIAYQQMNDRELLGQLGQIIVNKITGRALPDLVQPLERKSRRGKIKVGYISEHLSVSNGGSWARGWIKNHGPDIEKYAICLADNMDTVTAEFKKYSDHFFHLKDNVVANARMVKSLDLDVLIYTDIGMSGKNYQYASMRLAPVQCTAWGHPITSGLPTIDYYLSSDLMEPENGQEHYTEKLVRLPNSGLNYPRPTRPASRMFKQDFGLDEGPLYLSCQNPMKYVPRYDQVYKEICERTGRPIVFVEGPLPMEKSFLKERFAKAGINAKWLPGLGMSDFIALIKLADVCLDTPGWNGGNTTIQALDEGRPLLTVPGEFMRGRHSLAFLKVANVPGLIAKDLDEFVEMAADRGRLQGALSTLNADALFDDMKPVRALDDFFASVCR